MSDLGPRYGNIAAKMTYWLTCRRFAGDPHHVIVVTHCGKLGDFIACLPVASWLHKTRGLKIHFMLASKFPLFAKVKSLLMLQDMTSDVSFAEFPVEHWEKGGQPYKHNPNLFGIAAPEYYNLGFRRTPRRFVPQFVAEEYGLGYDKDFRIKLGEVERSDEIIISDPFMRDEVPHAALIDFSQDFLINARRMAGAREAHVCQSSMFHILDWAGVTPTCVYIYPHAANIHVFSHRLAEYNMKYVDRVVRPTS